MHRIAALPGQLAHKRRTYIEDFGYRSVMRTVSVLVALGCAACSDRDQSMTPQVCEASFEQAVDKACSVQADCTLISHPDCCGVVIIGIAKSMVAAAMAAEANYESCASAMCGDRGCAHDTQAEDGSVQLEGQTIVAICVNGSCASTVQ